MNTTWELERREKHARHKNILLSLETATSALHRKCGGNWTIRLVENSPHGFEALSSEVSCDTYAGGALTFSARVLQDHRSRPVRVDVSVELPTGVEHKFTPRGARPSGSFAAERGADGLAQTIRRIIEESSAWVKQTLAAKERSDAYDTATKKNLARLTKAAGALSHEHGDRNEFSSYAGPVSIEARASDDSVCVTLRSLPIDLAEKVLTLVREHNKSAAKKGE